MTTAQVISNKKKMNAPMMDAAKSTTLNEVVELSGVGVVLTARGSRNATMFPKTLTESSNYVSKMVTMLPPRITKSACENKFIEIVVIIVKIMCNFPISNKQKFTLTKTVNFTFILTSSPIVIRGII